MSADDDLLAYPTASPDMLSELELKRVERAVGALVAKRRPPAQIRAEVDLFFRAVGHSVEIFEVRKRWMGEGTQEIPVAKATYVKTRQVWRLFWQRSDLRWHRYDPLPEARSIDPLLAEIDADPYRCFWG